MATIPQKFTRIAQLQKFLDANGIKGTAKSTTNVEFYDECIVVKNGATYWDMQMARNEHARMIVLVPHLTSNAY